MVRTHTYHRYASEGETRNLPILWPAVQRPERPLHPLCERTRPDSKRLPLSPGPHPGPTRARKEPSLVTQYIQALDP